MKVYYDYENEEILTEEEATKYVKEDVLNDDSGIWEFIINHYSHNEIIERLPPDFIEEIVKMMTERRLKNESLFCIRDF